MDLLHTPELEKIKPFPTPSKLASPISTLLLAEVMAERQQEVRHTLPTPSTTPLGECPMDSFKNRQVTDNVQTAKAGIDRLRNGHPHTADFVPSWSATELSLAYDPNNSRYSKAELLVADTPVQLVNLHTECTDLQKENPCLRQAAPQSRHGLKERLLKVRTTSKTSDNGALPTGELSPDQQTQPISAKVPPSNKRTRLAAYHNGKAKSDKAIEMRRGDVSSYHGRSSQNVRPPLGSMVNTNWINSNLSLQEGGKYVTELQNCTDKLHRHREPMESAAARIVAKGHTVWNLWNVPRSELNKDVREWEAIQSELRPAPKPKSRPNAQKSMKRPPPAVAESVEVTRSRTSKRRLAQVEEPSSSDTVSIASQDGSEYVEEPPAKKAMTAFDKGEHSQKEQYDVNGDSVIEKPKLAGAKRKSPGEEQKKQFHGSAPKKGGPPKKSSIESKGPRRGNGESSKAKSPKDKRLEDIKYWLNSKTKMCFPPKKVGEPITPDHKADWTSLDFVRLPDLGSEIDDVSTIAFDEKLGPKGDYDGGDPENLHPKELELARLINLSYDQYRCQKRRVFAARAVFDRIQANERLDPEWRKTHTQLVGSIDANKSSYLFLNFQQWGWFQTMRQKWDDQYLTTLVDDFRAYSRRPWTPPSED